MTRLTALAYVSSAPRALSEAELEALLLSARAHNEQAQITGALLYHDGSFFQYLEGPGSSLDAAYARIAASRRHRGIIQLFRRPVDSRQFDGWHMGFAHAPKSVLLQLSQASWIEVLERNAGMHNAASGTKLLRQFWQNATRSR
jgi:Sensors of blue-light using FAD